MHCTLISIVYMFTLLIVQNSALFEELNKQTNTRKQHCKNVCEVFTFF